jgi:hypothetical protein
VLFADQELLDTAYTLEGIFKLHNIV